MFSATLAVIAAAFFLGSSTATPMPAPEGILEHPPEFGWPMTANFDNLTATPASTPPVGTYMHLNFQNFNAASQNLLSGGAQVAGVQAHSGSNVAASDPLSATTAGRTASITSDYAGSNVTKFDLRSFWFGCALPEAGSLAAPPTSCNVTVSGFRGNKGVAVEEFEFEASGGLTQGMTEAVLGKGFDMVTSAAFAAQGESTGGSVALVVDDVKFACYTKHGKEL